MVQYSRQRRSVNRVTSNGSGVGSGSMMSAASGALIHGLDEAMTQKVLSIAAASNLLSSALGALSLSYLGLPLSEKIYSIFNKNEEEAR
nr:DUF3100 domain-containing protein [Xenorhabdus sp. 5]